MATTKKEVQETGPGGLPVEAFDYGEDSGAGMEGVDREETRIPFVRVLQTNSPQLDESDSAFIKGAKVGDLCHMATGEIWPGDGTVKAVFAYREKDYVEWTPVEQGGGFVDRYEWGDPKIAALRAKQGRFGKLKTPDGTEIAQTFYLYGLVIPPDGIERRVVFGFESTQIKKYQSVIDRVENCKFIKDGKTMQPPLYAWRWRIRTGPEKNKKGKWHGIMIEPDGDTIVGSLLKRTDPTFQRARDFYELLKAGHATADRSQMGPDAAESASASAPDDVPLDETTRPLDPDEI